jgi:hypothetical protein
VAATRCLSGLQGLVDTAVDDAVEDADVDAVVVRSVDDAGPC